MENYKKLSTESDANYSNVTDMTPIIENPMYSMGARTIVILMFLLLIITGVFGNMLVCIVVARRPKMRTVINLFICNLASSDLLLCIVGVPLTLISFLKSRWILGLALCRISAMITGCMVFVSSLTLTVIAADRFCLVVYPFMKPIDKMKCLVTTIIIWVVSVGFQLPIGIQTYVFDFREIVVNGDIKCMEFWNVIAYRKRYAIALFLIQFCYPLILVSIAHASIAIKLARTNKPGMRRAETDHRENKKRQRMNKMLSSVVFVFAISWSPFNIYTLLQEYNFQSEHEDLIFIITYFLAISSAVVNPVLYAWLNDNFRKEFQKMLPFVPCFQEKKPRSHQPKSSGGATASNVISRTTDKRSQASLGTYLQPTCAESSVVAKATSPVVINEKKPVEIDTPI